MATTRSERGTKRKAATERGGTKKAAPAKGAAKAKPAGAKAAPEIGDEAVAAKTGKTWPEWVAALDALGCRALGHKEIVAVLETRFGIGPWWCQMVTVGYEKLAGLRQKHQKGETFEISGSKTVNVPIADLWAAWHDPARRRAWASDPGFTVRKATTERSMRITWVDGKTDVSVDFWKQSDAKSRVSLNHKKLASAAAADRQKKYWSAELARLAETLES